MRTRHIAGTALVLASLAACSEPIAPPDDVPIDACPGCLPKSFELRVDSVFIVTPLKRDSLRKRDVLAPENVQIGVAIRNTGDSVSNPIRISREGAVDTLPAIAPNTQRIYVVQTTVVDNVNQLDPAFARSISISIASDGETSTSGNFASTKAVFFEKPTLTAVATGPSTIPRVNRAFAGPFKMRNDGYRVSVPIVLVGCLTDKLAGCAAHNWTTFGSYAVPALQPGEEYIFADSITVRPTAAWQDEEYSYGLKFCEPGPDPNYTSGRCVTAGNIRLAPDYSSCAPPVMQNAVSTILTAYNCGLMPPAAGAPVSIATHSFHLVAVDLDAGRSYRIDRSTADVPARVYDANGAQIDDGDSAPDRFSVATAGRYYIVMYGTSPSLTVTIVKL